MSGTRVSYALWLAALGALPAEAPVRSPLGGFYGYDIGKPEFWPPRGAGPQRAVFWLRWWYDRLAVEGMDAQKADALRKQTLRELQIGERQVVAIHPHTGQEFLIPAHFWQSTGENLRERSWSGQWCMSDDAETPGDLFMIEPEVREEWWPGAKQTLRSWCAANGLADRVARQRLKEQKAYPSEKAVCEALSLMWCEGGREGGPKASIEETRRRERAR